MGNLILNNQIKGNPDMKRLYAIIRAGEIIRLYQGRYTQARELANTLNGIAVPGRIAINLKNWEK
jgi:hypothetical protein